MARRSWRPSVAQVFIALALVGVALFPDTAAAMTAEEEGPVALAICIACIFALGYAIGSGGLAALSAFIKTQAGQVVFGACYGECRTVLADLGLD